MRDKKVGSVVITNSDGLLIGVLDRKDAEERLPAIVKQSTATSVLFRAVKGHAGMIQESNDQYRCEECGATFDSQVEWEQHNRKVHSRYTCENCQEHFGAEEEFAAHNFKMHPELQKIQR